MTQSTIKSPDLVRFRVIGIAIVLIAFCVVSLCATQFLAMHFAFAPELGPEWGMGLYSPMSWILWQTQFYQSDPDTFVTVDLVCAGVMFVLMFGSVIWVGSHGRRLLVTPTSHGSARWITSLAELRRIGMVAAPKQPLPPSSIYLATVGDENGAQHYIRHAGNEHFAVIAPTRTGKGVGPILLNSFAWPGAFIALDPKGETYAASAGHRARRGPVWRWNPAGVGPGHHAYNFLDTIRLGTLYEVGDAQDIAALIVDPSSAGEWDHWEGSAFGLLTGAILYVLYRARAEGRRVSLADITTALNNPDQPADDLYDVMAKNSVGEPGTNGFTDGVRHRVIASVGRALMNKDARERASVHSSATRPLALFFDPIVAANTARSDFAIEDIWNGERPGSFYITVSPDKEIKLQPLLRMMLTLLFRCAMRPELEYRAGQAVMPWRHRTLALLDEFPTLGEINQIEVALAKIAGYGVQLGLFVQDAPQLWKTYTENESILAGCQVKLVYAPNDYKTAEWLSRECGESTFVKLETTISGDRHSASLTHASESIRESTRALMTPQEARRLKAPIKDPTGRIVEPGDVIILRTGYQPIFASQALYFLDPYYRELVTIPPPHQTISLSPIEVGA